MLEKEIAKDKLLEGDLPEIVKAISDSIPSQTIPKRMKVALAVSEVMLYASEFRINIQHWNGSSIPINSIMFCIAKSGAAKDSSIKAARKCFNKGYEIIEETRKNIAVDRAIELAKENGCDVPDKFCCYKDYYRAPNPLFVGISTPEGFVQHLNDLDEDKLGAGFLYTGELGSELINNLNMPDMLKILAETYDEGTKEVKVLKARENQSKEIKGLPVSALLMGSQDNILFDEAIKRRFKIEFTTKLARRSFFIFVYEDVPQIEYQSIQDVLKIEREIEDTAIENRNQVSEYIEDLTNRLLNKKNKTISVSEDVRDMFILYKKYNEQVADTLNSQWPISKLTRQHLQWKALKLAGAFALVEGYDSIEANHYRAAIAFVESINDDVELFEKELVKEPYELFTDYVRLYAKNHEYTISLHQLRKYGFIPMKGQSNTHLKELVKLANSYDENGIYSLNNDEISFKEITKTNQILLSYIPVTGNKKQRAMQCSKGFTTEELLFEDLEEMLKGDYAYTPFKFINGVRGRDNIESGCKWLVLDIDSSEITDEEAHILIEDINHYIVRTSNKDNPNKYRILIELDSEVNLPSIQWKVFLSTVAEDLGFVVDVLPKSQIYFSYSDRNILKVLDQNPLETKKYLSIATEIDAEPKKLPSKKACQSMLEDPMTTFNRAFEALDGEGSRKMIWACRRARELGADKDYCIDLLDKISNYWVKPLPDNRLENIKNQVSKWIFD